LRQRARAAENSPPRDRQLLLARSVAISAGTDIVGQGDKPRESVFVISGMLARYHTVANGERQYLSLHVRGDFPDVQSLLLGQDHGLAAIDDIEIALLPHQQLKSVLSKSQAITLAFWCQTLLDAAIFRQAITTNGTRQGVARVAHLFCEQFVRAEQVGIAVDNTCSFPLTQTEIGQMLGLSVVTVNRALQACGARAASNCARAGSPFSTGTNWKSALFSTGRTCIWICAPRPSPRRGALSQADRHHGRCAGAAVQ
jgi:CRP-like cAMP-binding protein